MKSARFERLKRLIRPGYVLEIFKAERRIDAQLYDPVEGGRRMITMDVPPKIDIKMLESGMVYEFEFDSFCAPLDGEVIRFLREERDTEMDAIYRFELKRIRLLDAQAR